MLAPCSIIAYVPSTRLEKTREPGKQQAEEGQRMRSQRWKPSDCCIHRL